MWKNMASNKYPDIILHDCFIIGINMDNDNIVLNFSEYGFFVFDKEKGNSFRTNGAQIVIEGCVVEDISIEEERMQKLGEDVFYKTLYEIKTSDFFENINSKKWSFEIVEEFYASGAGFFTGRIGTKDDRFWCHIKIYFKNLVYHWNDICYDKPF